MIQKLYAEMYYVSCAKIHRDVTTFEVNVTL